MKITYTDLGGGANRGEVEVLTFPSGERLPKMPFALDPGEPVLVRQSIESGSDLLDLALVGDALDRMGVKTRHLSAPYIMGARQDRVCNYGEPLSARVAASMINSQSWDSVCTFHPHSDVLPALINNCKVSNITADMAKRFVKTCIGDKVFPGRLAICSPDAGASKRVFKIYTDLHNSTNPHCTASIAYSYAEGGKKRDPKDGSLAGFTVDREDFEGSPVLVIDDICANGGTFLGLGKLLKERNAGNIYLMVAHADHMQGLEKMKEYYAYTCTTNSRSNSRQDIDARVLVHDCGI
jgi:ribose-phosphate pyrophosphokinase